MTSTAALEKWEILELEKVQEKEVAAVMMDLMAVGLIHYYAQLSVTDLKKFSPHFAPLFYTIAARVCPQAMSAKGTRERRTQRAS